MSDRPQQEFEDLDATLTMWRENIPASCCSEDSIRLADHNQPTAVTVSPRLRTLSDSEEGPADFRLGEQIGAGGMGVVYAARQTVLDREVAVKMVTPGRTVHAADALMTEAVITGRLEHPNVVPVYDLGVDSAGNLFYAMKEVQGQSWSSCMVQQAIEENLDILMRVADTISFAHSRGVLHRDLKPHNIMLGEFGEVMVLDWGASCMIDTVAGDASGSAFCGTPAYMPPEVARGDSNRLNETSDVYLLGAMLYQLVTGRPPRRETDPLLCIAIAAENFIEPVEEDSELIRIALQAMAAAPADRFTDVREFQKAVRGVRSHAESLHLMESARKNLNRACEERDYELFNRAVFGFQESLQLWPGNRDAHSLQGRAEIAYARCAFDLGDLELAQSVLDPENPKQHELLDLIRKALGEREVHKRRNRRLLLTARMLMLVLLVLFVTGFVLVRNEQNKTAVHHRQSLINLVAAYYGEQNYEAAVDAFLDLNRRYGHKRLDDDILLHARVAAELNPWRGAVDSGIEGALGIVPSADAGCVWVVGQNRMRKLELIPNPEFKRNTMVAVHRYSFGERHAAGRILQNIELPVNMDWADAVHESGDGSLWAGCGSIIYTYNDSSWDAVMDLGKVAYPNLPAVYNIDRMAVETWMNTEGCLLPIRNLQLNRAGTHAAVALGANTVCWINLEKKICEGWLAAGHGTRFGELLQGGEETPVDLCLSPDEKTLVFHPAGMNASMVFTLKVPSMERTHYVYNRDYPVRAVAVSSRGRFSAVAQNGYFFAPHEVYERQFNEVGGFFLGPDNLNYVRWEPQRCELRELPFSNIRMASVSSDARRCFALTDDGVLYASGSVALPGFEQQWRVINRDWVDCSFSDSGRALFLDSEGAVHVYDLDCYSVAEIPVPGAMQKQGRSKDPHALFAAWDESGTGRIGRVQTADSGETELVVLLESECDYLNADSDDRYLVVTEGEESSVYEISTMDKVHAFSVIEHTPAVQTRFDAGGRYLCRGGSLGDYWLEGIKLFRTDTWEFVDAKRYFGDWKEQFTDVMFDRTVAGESLYLVHPKTEHVFGMTMPDNLDDAPEQRWVCGAGSVPVSVIPYTDPESGRRRLWCQLWFNSFISIDAETGEIHAMHEYWKKSGLIFPEFLHDGKRVVFPTGDGRILMALKEDLYPVFDSRLLNYNAEKPMLSCDGERLYFLSDGKLFCMKIPAIRQ